MVGYGVVLKVNTIKSVTSEKRTTSTCKASEKRTTSRIDHEVNEENNREEVK